jgi:hypothetical protein
LHHIADLEAIPILEPHSTLRAFTHLLHVSLDVLQGGNDTYSSN